MLIMFTLSLITSSMGVFAVREVNDVNNSQSSTVEESSQTSTIAGGLSQAFSDTALSDEDIANASKFMSPYVKMVNGIIAAVLACFSVILGAVTVIDLLYIACPPIRKFLMPQQAQATGGMGSMGMGSMGMGGMHSMGGMQQNSSIGSRIGGFISDEAIAAVSESTPQAQGGMGMGMGMMQPQAKPKTKSIIMSYAKKRAFALICFFACLVLFTSTVFTDLGLYIGQWIVDTISSLF